MNSGFSSFVSKGKIKSVGVHQRLDRQAYQLITYYNLSNKDLTGKFPALKKILHFEGINGPDGLKVKSKNDVSHLWDPISKVGHLPTWIEIHHQQLILALQKEDHTEAAFQSAWMAHYLADGMTPAHHIDFNKIEEKMLTSKQANLLNKMRKKWLYYGYKGLLSSHLIFEFGIGFYLIASRTKPKFDADLLQQIKKQGLKRVFEIETSKVGELDLYNNFLTEGWNGKILTELRNSVLIRIPQLISASWQSAIEEAFHK